MVYLRQKSSTMELFVNNERETTRNKSVSRQQRRRTRSLSRECLRKHSPSRSTSREHITKNVKKRKSLRKKSINETNNPSDECRSELFADVTKQYMISSSNKPANKPMNTKLIDAILENDSILLRKLIIIDEYNVNEVSYEGTTCLHIASAAGYLDCVSLLLECGGSVDLIDNNSRTPLEYAVLYGNFDCASELIKYGANTNVIKNGIV